MSGEVAKLPHVRYVLAHVPDGTKGWGGGVEEGSYEQFENYVKAVDQLQACPTYSGQSVWGLFMRLK